MLIDTHTHLYSSQFNDDLSDVVDRALSCGVEKMFLPNIDVDSVESMLDLCARWPGVMYPMMGLHPTDVKEDYREVLSKMEVLLANSPYYIGVGEVGIDLYWEQSLLKEQLDAFDIQVQWAIKYNLPLAIHTRSAHKEMMAALAPYKDSGLTGVFHSFGGSLEEASEMLEFEGFVLGINGVVTYKNSGLPAVLKHVPLERLVIETDSPYLPPVPHRGKRNESSYALHVADKLSDIYEMLPEKICEVTSRTAMAVFPLSQKALKG